MSSLVVVIACVVVLVACGCSRAITQRGLPELMALDAVLQDLQSVLETRGTPYRRATLIRPLAGVNNITLYRVGNNVAPERSRGRILSDPEDDAEYTRQDVGAVPNSTHPHARRTMGRVKRVSPTPPPSRCPYVPPPPDYLSKWEQLKYLLERHPPGCPNACPTMHGCPRRPMACAHQPEALMLRLALLEDKLREVDRMETRFKIHISLLTAIQSNPKYPGQPGEPGYPGRKGHQGFKGLPGSPGLPGSCQITGQANPATGPLGPPGNKGNPGPPGDKICDCDGDRGDIGAPGAHRRGTPGPKGPKGIKGERGRDLPLLHG